MHVHLQAPTLESIQAPKIFEQISGLQSGLVVVSGNVGSGRSTTLAAILDNINKNRRVTVATIEECVEFHHENVLSTIVRNRHNVGESIDLPWVKALLENPDVLIIDSDREAHVKLALQAASKRLVFLTVHSRGSVVDALNRMMYTFPNNAKAGMTLSHHLRAVISQVMLPTISGKSVVAHEIMMVGKKAQGLLAENNLSGLNDYLYSDNVENGTQTMQKSLDALVKSGVVSETNATIQQQYMDLHNRVA